jgi:hypothetical protein
LKGLKIIVALFSETHLKPHIMFYVPTCDFVVLTVMMSTNVELPLQLKMHPPHIGKPAAPPSVEKIGICTPIGKTEVFGCACL